MRHLALFALSSCLLTTGCSGDTACGSSSDCFQGEICIDQTCELPANAEPGRDGGNNVPNNANNNPNNVNNLNNLSNSDAGAADTMPNSERIQCLIDPFQNTCDDDPHEPNENVNTFAPLLFDNQSWCNAGALVETQTSGPLTMCAGDTLDVFRLMIDNRTPDECITNQFTWQVEVRFQTPCSEDIVAIEPYFNSPFSDDLCENDERFRCEWSSDEQTFLIQYLRQPDQLMDFNIAIGPPSSDTINLQFDYDVVMTIIQ